ncbi:glycosyltransferase [Agreia sp. COWG]|uniref:glycosyltransferase n=1 Tax=Agreia sp. COWG TaxID=2773266 RepID=UPI001AF5CFFA|nr:glycosyltransferase [Agreia sp. COWG]CAD5993204.1 Glycosyl transferase [Agreia sp. COWG]
MATYRGEPYVKEQIDSILRQLGDDDELIVVDDASADATVAVVRSIADPRIVLRVHSTNVGYVRTFEEAIGHARGEFIFLSDQDDVWSDGRLDLMLHALQTRLVVAGNYSVLNEAGRMPARRPLRREYDGRTAANIVAVMIGYRPYFGCAMGFRRELTRVLLPFPAVFVESHDLWLALSGIAHRSVAHLPDVVVERRLHEYNVTPLRWRPLPTILRARFMLLQGYVLARHRARRLSRPLG